MMKWPDFFYKFMEIKSWTKNIEVEFVKSGCGHCGSRTLKLAVSQEGIGGKKFCIDCMLIQIQES